jgi:ribonuclease P/MRP protein subunit RPP40
MLDLPAGTKHEAKCNVTHGTMGHLDPKQPPVKRKPFAAILNHSFVQKVCGISWINFYSIDNSM